MSSAALRRITTSTAWAAVALATIASLQLVFPSHASAIYGGQPVTSNPYPWLVSVQIDLGKGPQADCGGTVVASDWVLTAAHCVTTWAGEESSDGCDVFTDLEGDGCKIFSTAPHEVLPEWNVRPASQFSVLVGRDDFNNTAVGKRLSVNKIAVAPYFQPVVHVAGPGTGCRFLIESQCEGTASFDAVTGDVALLHLASPATSIPPVTLRATSIPNSTFVRVAGWGRSTFGDPTQGPVLRQTPSSDLATVDSDDCISSSAAEYADPSQLVCAWSTDNDTGTGQGDSGGPLLHTLPDGSVEEVGVVSFAPLNTPVASLTQPDAFASVAANYKYIEKVIAPPATTTTSSGPIDLVFAIDTTGSMSPYIDSTVSSASSIVDSLAASGSSFRVGVVDYKDSDFGCGDYDAVTDLGFSTDKTAIVNALGALPAKVEGGCDTPEDVYSGVERALDFPWRNGVTKSVIVLGDAPGHDPEPHSGLTLASVTAHAKALDPVQVYSVLVGGDDSAHDFDQALADATGAQTFDATSDPTQTGPEVLDAVQTIETSHTPTKTTVAADPTSVVMGDDSTLDALVTPTPTEGLGSVTFTEDGNTLSDCSGLRVHVDGSATCDTSDLGSIGSHDIVASFSGDDDLAPSTSDPDTLNVVTQPPPPPPTPVYPVQVSMAGGGTGTVTGSGIDCPGTCSIKLLRGEDLSLTATPAAGSTFAGWSGDCTGTGTCLATVNAAKNVTATFNPVSFGVSVTIAGDGSGAVSGAGISCPGACSTTATSGSHVDLVATPTSGSSFAGWSGACSGSGACAVTMTSASTVTATFTVKPVTLDGLLVSMTGTGSGSVSGPGITCPGTCSNSYTPGTSVVLTATPASGSTFAGWSGACEGSDACTVSMDAATNVTAIFTVDPTTTTPFGRAVITVFHNGWRASTRWICLVKHKGASLAGHRTAAGRCVKTRQGAAVLTGLLPGTWHLLAIRNGSRTLSTATITVTAGTTVRRTWHL